MPKFLLCDIPDEHQPVREYLKEVKRDYPYASIEALYAGIGELEFYGPAVAGCVDIGKGCWRFSMMLGFGRKANFIFIRPRSGDYLAVHAFTSETEMQMAAGCSTGIARKEALE
jgi:hypothetical protein